MIAAPLIFTLVGAIVGSFVGAAVIRVPAARGIVAGRSSCDACGKVLRSYELIPILSYAWQRGRCRRCRSPIAIDQPIAEMACAIAGLLAAYSTGSVTGALLLAIFGWTLVALALLDARHHWLPDLLTLPLMLLGLIEGFFSSSSDLVDRAAGAVGGYLLLQALRLLYRRIRHREGLGGGDPKLFAAIGAWLGASVLPWVMLVAGGLGLVWVGWLTLRGRRLSRADRLALGTLLAVAAIVIMPVVMTGGVITPST
jgi:leader peptidase (prepilin peptidase)/N-methyltransferase